MRQFLYYNHDSINSFLAQIEQGLLLKKEADETTENTTSSTEKIQSNVTGDLSAKILGIGASLQGDIKGTNSDTEIATQMVRNIQEKALHDYAFNKVFDYIDTNSLINNENPQIGDIVLVNELPTFLDFNYFQALFSENGPVKFSNEQSKKQMDDKLVEIRGKVPKGASMPELIKIQIKNLESKIRGCRTRT